MDTQLKKGLLEFCVLAALKKEESYGYQIIKDISKYIEISESTLYPILRRLESEGFVETHSVAYNNRLRKYYKITYAGTDYLNDFNSKQESLYRLLDFIKGEYSNE